MSFPRRRSNGLAFGMPDIALFHPQIVHFVIAGAGLGLLFRWISLTGKLKWTDGAATALLVIGAGAAVLAHGSTRATCWRGPTCSPALA